MSVPREDSDGAVPRAAAPEPPSGASPEEMEVREGLTIEAKEVREAIRFGHADATERLFSFVERIPDSEWGHDVAGRLCQTILRHNGNAWHSVVSVLRRLAAGQRQLSSTFDRLEWIPPSILDAIRSECAALAQVEEARLHWERAKAVTDDAIRREVERAKARAAFLPIKNRIVEEIRALLNAIHEEGELSPEIEKQCLDLRSDLSDWEDRPPQDVEKERTIAERIRNRASDLQRAGRQWRVVRDQLRQARSEAREAIRALDEKEVQWESLLPETLQDGIVALARETIQRAKATFSQADSLFCAHIHRDVENRFRQSIIEASNVDQIWREKTRSVYGTLAKAGDAPLGCSELADWIKRTVNDAAPAPVFTPDPPDSDPLPYDWPWMPPQERHLLPKSPIAILSIVGNPRKAGEWFAELDRFSRDMRRHPDQFDDSPKRARLANVTRRLAAVTTLQDMSSIRNQINELLGEIHSEDDVRNWKKLVNRLDVNSSGEDRDFFDSFRQQCETYLDLRNDGEYEKTAILYREIRARAIELGRRSQRQEPVVCV